MAQILFLGDLNRPFDFATQIVVVVHAKLGHIEIARTNSTVLSSRFTLQKEHLMWLDYLDCIPN